jgi:hypothetical protein
MAAWALSACFNSLTRLFAKFPPALAAFGWVADCAALVIEPAGSPGRALSGVGASLHCVTPSQSFVTIRIRIPWRHH